MNQLAFAECKSPIRSGVFSVRMMACHNLSLRNGGRAASAANEPPFEMCTFQLNAFAFRAITSSGAQLSTVACMDCGGTRRVCFASSVTSQSVLHYANRLFAIIFYATALDMPTIHTFIRSGDFFLVLLHIRFSSD